MEQDDRNKTASTMSDVKIALAFLINQIGLSEREIVAS